MIDASPVRVRAKYFGGLFVKRNRFAGGLSLLATYSEFDLVDTPC